MRGVLDDEQDQQSKYPITVCIQFSNGTEYNQPLELDSDGAQAFMDWFRDKKSGDVWTWQVPLSRNIHMMHRAHIVAVDVYGYIELQGEKTKWYQRLLDRLASRIVIFVQLKLIKGGERRGKKSNHESLREVIHR